MHSSMVEVTETNVFHYTITLFVSLYQLYIGRKIHMECIPVWLKLRKWMYFTIQLFYLSVCTNHIFILVLLFQLLHISLSHNNYFFFMGRESIFTAFLIPYIISIFLIFIYYFIFSRLFFYIYLIPLCMTFCFHYPYYLLMYTFSFSYFWQRFYS